MVSRQRVCGEHRLVARELVGDLVWRPALASAEPGVGAVEVPELVAIRREHLRSSAGLRRDDWDHAAAYRNRRLVLPARRGPGFAEGRDLFRLQPIES